MGHQSYEGLHIRLFQDESDTHVARRLGLKDVTLIILALLVIGILMRESYDRGAEDGYWEAINEENAYLCEVF